jgi:hypothetical protein
MKTRFFVHTEQIDFNGQIRCFVIDFPPNTAKIISLVATAEPMAKDYEIRHLEVGLLTLYNAAGVWYESQIRFSGQLTWFPKIPPYSYLDHIRQMPVSGAKLTGQTLDIPALEPYLNARFETSPSLSGFRLKLTFTYLENEN